MFDGLDPLIKSEIHLIAMCFPTPRDRTTDRVNAVFDQHVNLSPSNKYDREEVSFGVRFVPYHYIFCVGPKQLSVSLHRGQTSFSFPMLVSIAACSPLRTRGSVVTKALCGGGAARSVSPPWITISPPKSCGCTRNAGGWIVMI